MVFKDIKILAVSDDQENLAVLKASINEAFSGSRLISAINEMQIVEIAFSIDPDVILIDLDIQGMDGIAICRKLKADEQLRIVPVIFLTAPTTDYSSRIKAVEAGAEAFLAKPLDKAEVIAQIRTMTKVKAASRMQPRDKRQLISTMDAHIRELEQKLAEHKDTERELYESERKYRELVENANSIILRWTRDGKVTYLNEFGQRFFGYSSEEIVGNHVIGTIVPETDTNGRNMRQFMEQILFDPASFERNTNENMRRNGERVWIAWTNKIIKDVQGKISEILSIGTDITERKKMDEKLKESETQLSLIFNNVSDIVFAISVEPNERFRFIQVNRRFLEATGLTESKVVGKLVQNVIPQLSHALVFQKYHEAIQSGQPAHWEEVSDYPAGKKYGHVTVVPIFDDHGNCTQLIGMVHDITDRKQAEDAIRELNTRLEQRVAERTAELAVARDRAEAADHLKSAFLATMSHELRTPLNSIIGFTGIILQGLAGPLNEEQHKQLKMVRNSAQHLLALINDVLDISKIEAGQLEVFKELFNLRSSITEVANSVKPLAEKKGLSLRVELAPEIGTLVSDHRRVEQVLLNLLNNAIKFTERGEVTLTAKIVKGTLYPEVHITVADTGIGIKPEDLSKLFQPFRQVDSGLIRQHEGTGLGLAISRRLADLLGGEIHVKSEWGKGSIFTFTLPIQERKS